MLKRTLSRLKYRPFDVLVIGGTHLGGLIAWDASLRGLRVALIAPTDFGESNDPIGLSLIRGGFRFMNGSSFQEARQLVKERQAFLRIAPHLIRPLPQLLISEKNEFRYSYPALGAASKANQLINFNHNFGLEPGQFIDHGRPLFRRQILKMNPQLESKKRFGSGLYWDEAQIIDSQRLQLAILKSAVDAGAVVANYIRVEELRTFRSHVIGADVVDELNGASFEIGAKMVIDATEGAIDTYLRHDVSMDALPNISLTLLTKQLIPDHGLHVIKAIPDNEPGDRSLSSLSIVPWGNCSLIGPFKTKELIEWSTEKLLHYVNQTFPAANLKGHDIYQILPQLFSTDSSYQSEEMLFEHAKLIDHAVNGGPHGILSVRTPDFESSRYLAEKTVDHLFNKLHRSPVPCQTRKTRVHGGQIVHWDTFQMAVMDKWPVEMPPYQIKRFLTKYGSQHGHIFPMLQDSMINCQPIGEETAVTRAEILYAIKYEMAQKLTDVVMRRTELGSSISPNVETVEAIAQIMAEVCNWSKERMTQELDEAFTSISTLHF